MVELACTSPAPLQVFTSFPAVYIDVLEILLVPVFLPSLAQGRFQLHSFAGTTRPFVCNSHLFSAQPGTGSVRKTLFTNTIRSRRTVHESIFRIRRKPAPGRWKCYIRANASSFADPPGTSLYQPEPHQPPGLTYVLEGRLAIFGSCSKQPWPQ
jgi:hypothetical protein